MLLSLEVICYLEKNNKCTSYLLLLVSICQEKKNQALAAVQYVIVLRAGVEAGHCLSAVPRSDVKKQYREEIIDEDNLKSRCYYQTGMAKR